MYCALAVVALSLALSLGLPPKIASQSQETAENRAEILDAARDLMRASHYCALITLGDDGRPLARTMDPFEPTPDFHVWLGTNKRTHKIAQIRKDPRVTLYYFSPDSPGYVTILGSARIVDDAAARKQYWKKEWADFYEDGNEGPDYILIEVVPQTIQVVSYSHGIASDPQTWGPATVNFP